MPTVALAATLNSAQSVLVVVDDDPGMVFQLVPVSQAPLVAPDQVPLAAWAEGTASNAARAAASGKDRRAVDLSFMILNADLNRAADFGLSERLRFSSESGAWMDDDGWWHFPRIVTKCKQPMTP